MLRNIFWFPYQIELVQENSLIFQHHLPIHISSSSKEALEPVLCFIDILRSKSHLVSSVHYIKKFWQGRIPARDFDYVNSSRRTYLWAFHNIEWWNIKLTATMCFLCLHLVFHLTLINKYNLPIRLYKKALCYAVYYICYHSI